MTRTLKFFLTPISLSLFVFGLMSLEEQEPVQIADYHHTAEELKNMLANAGVDSSLPVGDEEGFFRGSGLCEGCHGYDPNEIASLDGEGNDINPTDQWRATMMANSARDPFWRAKVSHETAVNPANTVELEDKCTSCHAPLGHYGARFDEGATHFSMEELLADSLALDGVSCNACHAQSDVNIGDLFSGILNFSEDTIYGPYGDIGDPVIFSQPMFQFVGFQPEFGAHVEKSELCAGCHTLITNTADLEGNLTGGTFVEQATYHEWENSIYSEEGDNNKECQSCHFPRIDDPVVISSNYAFLEPRTPYGQHYMVGGNTFMLELMKNRINELGIPATEEDFDAVIQRTMDQLTQETLELEMTELGADNDTASYELKLTNLSGHKFPSGYPSRRAFIEFLVEADNGDTLFHSGNIQNDYEVTGQDPNYEPHYGTIMAEDQVQIYEMVMGDVNSDVTTVLERADHPIKDNRLTPKGFSTSHAVYDTTLIAGLALLDLDFNHEMGIEGSGTDRITYKAPMNGYEGDINVTARVHYQSVPPKWNEEMFMFTTPEIESFREMYNAEGADPVLIEEASLTTFVQSTTEIDNDNFIYLYPNPVSQGESLRIESNKIISTVEIYSIDGQLVHYSSENDTRSTQIQEHFAKGAYLILITNKYGESSSKRFVVR